MNGRNAKKYRKKGKQILVEWLHSVIPDSEDKTLINVDNLEEFLSDQTHVYLNSKFLLSAYSLKWIYKRVKKNPDLTFKQLQKDIEREQGITSAQQGHYL
jgi:hypothetical protein|tara:strand:- start:289 stop:588 length:300 start_codon:yes stop_codon:yes gene_type:complete